MTNLYLVFFPEIGPLQELHYVFSEVLALLAILLLFFVVVRSDFINVFNITYTFDSSKRFHVHI